MPSLLTIVLVALASMFAVLSLARISGELARRKRAGPVLFRLPLASMARPPRGSMAAMWMLVAAAVLLLWPTISRANLSSGALAGVFVWMAANNLQARHPRRAARRWRVLEVGLIALLVAAMILVLGFRRLQPGDPLYGLPPWFLIVWSASMFLAGASSIEEFLAGTRVREGGIELFGTTYPWSRIAVKGWEGDGDESVLRLAIVVPRWKGVADPREAERLVPVPASQRPALETFLKERVPVAD